MRHHTGPGGSAARADRADPDEDAEDAARPFGQDIRHALGLGQPEPRVGLPGREADRVGLLLHQQGARHPSALLLGHDLRLRPQWQLRGLRVSQRDKYWRHVTFVSILSSCLGVCSLGHHHPEHHESGS